MIMNWKETLRFPDDVEVSPEAEDLIRRLCCDPEERLGRHGADEIKQHPFFVVHSYLVFIWVVFGTFLGHFGAVWFFFGHFGSFMVIIFGHSCAFSV